MIHRYDSRFVTSYSPTPQGNCFTFQNWTTHLRDRYPTGYSDELREHIVKFLRQYGVDYRFPIQRQEGVNKELDCSWFTGLCKTLLTLHTMGPPLHNGQTFYLNFNLQTKETIEQRRNFKYYFFKREYCIIDTLFRTFVETVNESLYLGIDTAFNYPTGTTVAFHYFASASRDLSEVIESDRFRSTVLELVNTRGLRTREQSQYPHEEEYLIYPFDEFVVRGVNHHGDYDCFTLEAKPPVSFQMNF